MRVYADLMVDEGDLPFAVVREDGRVVVRLARDGDQAINLYVPPRSHAYVAELISQLQLAQVGMAAAS